MALSKDSISPYDAYFAAILGVDQATTPSHKRTTMIYDVHSHNYPIIPGTAIVQLTPEAFHPQTGHFYSVGLHPWDIRDDWRTQMSKLLVMALHTHVVMIGETGLDKKNSSTPIDVQMEVFREHIRLSELIRKPLIVHCVKAFDELLAIRKEMKAQRPWIIHGFRGGIEQWKQLHRAGLYMSIGHSYNPELIKTIDPEHLLLESDVFNDIETIYDLVSSTNNLEVSTLKHHVASNIHHILTHI